MTNTETQYTNICHAEQFNKIISRIVFFITYYIFFSPTYAMPSSHRCISMSMVDSRWQRTDQIRNTWNGEEEWVQRWKCYLQRVKNILQGVNYSCTKRKSPKDLRINAKSIKHRECGDMNVFNLLIIQIGGLNIYQFLKLVKKV